MNSSNIEKAYCLDALLEQIIVNFNEHYDYYQLNLNSWKIMIYNYLHKNKIFLPENLPNQYLDSYNYNIVNELLYYMEKRPKSELISVKNFIDYLNQKQTKNPSDEYLVKYLKKINRYKQKDILDNLVLAQYEQDRFSDVCSKLIEYIDKSEVKQFYRYRLKKGKNYRKALIENIYPDEVYGVVVSRIIEMGHVDALNLPTRDEVIKFYVDKTVINYQTDLFNKIVEKYYHDYGIVVTSYVLKEYIQKNDKELLDSKQHATNKYLPKRKKVKLLNNILINKNIDIKNMTLEEKIDSYLYDFETVKCKGN